MAGETFGEMTVLNCKKVLWFFYTIYCAIESWVLTTLVPRSYRRKDIKGRIALVTGGGSGIGRLMCLKLAAKGAIIVTWDVSAEGNAETEKQVVASGGKCRAYTVDLCDRHSVYALAAKVKQEVGKVDILINNAGVVTGKKLMDSSDESIIRSFEVNTICHFWTVKAFLGDMIARNSGHIVTISSMAGKAPRNGLVDYCATKYAACGFHDSLAMELKAMGKKGIKTLLVCPVQINTGFMAGMGTRFVPLLTPDWTASEIVDAILMDVPEILLPPGAKKGLIYNLLLPTKSQYYLAELTEAIHLMDNFVGRRKDK